MCIVDSAPYKASAVRMMHDCIDTEDGQETDYGVDASYTPLLTTDEDVNLTAAISPDIEFVYGIKVMAGDFMIEAVAYYRKNYNID